MTYRKLPPLSELAAFEAIARHRSFTKAAKELFLTPSAISQRIRQLESRLDTQFFVRTRRSVKLTAAGMSYLESVQTALGTLEAASDRLGNPGTRQLCLGIVPALASNWLIYKLRSFHQQQPAIDLHIQAAIGMANLKAGEVDIAIRLGKGNWPGLEKFKLFPDELLAVCSKAYLKETGPLRKPTDLQKVVLLRNAIQPWKPWFEQAGLDWPEPARGPLFSDSTLALQAAVDGHGVALERRMLVRHLLEHRILVTLFDVSVATDEAFYVVYLAESRRRPEVAAFINWIQCVAMDEKVPPES